VVSPGDLLLPLEQNFVDCVATLLRRLSHEALLLVYLDRAGAFLGDELITAGTNCSLGLPYRVLFERAFRRGATRLVLAHNHPSGSAEPSALDIRSTRGLQALAAPMEIRLDDHLIVGAHEVFSMRAAGLVMG
jgi:DNA repair protein RadC